MYLFKTKSSARKRSNESRKQYKLIKCSAFILPKAAKTFTIYSLPWIYAWLSFKRPSSIETCKSIQFNRHDIWFEDSIDDTGKVHPLAPKPHHHSCGYANSFKMVSELTEYGKLLKEMKWRVYYHDRFKALGVESKVSTRTESLHDQWCNNYLYHVLEAKYQCG